MWSRRGADNAESIHHDSRGRARAHNVLICSGASSAFVITLSPHTTAKARLGSVLSGPFCLDRAEYIPICVSYLLFARVPFLLFLLFLYPLPIPCLSPSSPPLSPFCLGVYRFRSFALLLSLLHARHAAYAYTGCNVLYARNESLCAEDMGCPRAGYFLSSAKLKSVLRGGTRQRPVMANFAATRMP